MSEEALIRFSPQEEGIYLAQFTTPNLTKEHAIPLKNELKAFMDAPHEQNPLVVFDFSTVETLHPSALKPLRAAHRGRQDDYNTLKNRVVVAAVHPNIRPVFRDTRTDEMLKRNYPSNLSAAEAVHEQAAARRRHAQNGSPQPAERLDIAAITGFPNQKKL